MNRSSKYEFYLPQNTDPISVSDFNYNFQIIDDNLITEEQSFTSTQKSTARANIGAADAADMPTLSAKGNLSLEENMTAGEATIWKYGKLGCISLRGAKRSSTGSGWTKIATLPSGYYPAYTTYALFANDSDMSSGSTTVFECRLDTSGDVNIYSPQANKNMWGSFTYIIG